jgi:signal transduction histidine kinase
LRAAAAAADDRIRVVVVDDNADIVHYIRRLLENCAIVEAAHDVASGLAAVRAFNPDLVLVDVMMAGADGLELVRAIRADPAIHTVSVIVLSARAGADARVDALAAGADEYLAKPFSGGELVARVSSNVRMARIRRAAVEQELELQCQIRAARSDLASVLEGTSDAFVSLDAELRLLALNEVAACELGAPIGELVGRKLTELGGTLVGSEVAAALRAALARRVPLTLERFDGASARWFNVRCFPGPDGLIVFYADITERKQAERMLVDAKAELARRVEARTEELRQANGLLNVLYLRLQTVREEERTALAREVHDQLGQTLSAAKIDLKLLEDDLRLHGAALAGATIITELQSACATLDRAMQLVREIATELRAPELDGQGLYAAIDWHARDFERRTRIAIHLELAAGLEQPARPVAEALLRILREAMTNVLRHANAANVWVSIERRAGALLLRVRDDGAGIARRRAPTHRSLGITGMRERAALAGGRLTVGPARQQGTLVSALIPMHGAAPRQGGRP